MKVVIIQESLRQYRVGFFELLREKLASSGVQLELVYGTPNPKEFLKGDLADIAWGHRIRNRFFRLGSRHLTWQPCLDQLKNADLVIVEQASRHVLNYVLLLRRRFNGQFIAFWGHGKNFQGHRANRFSELLKRYVSKRVDWWFAYNDLSREVVASLGFSKDRITSVHNAIDTSRLVDCRNRITEEDLGALRQSLGINGKNVCIFSGSLYPEKRLEFLVLASDLVHNQIPDFELLVLGGGPEREKLEALAQNRSWLRVLGPQFDNDKVLYFALSRLFLLPGTVGLAILDAFALELPLVTIDLPYHGPEIAYLSSGYNGVVLEKAATVADYANKVIWLLTNNTARLRLVNGCRESRGRYTLENMVERFASGIQAALVARRQAG